MLGVYGCCPAFDSRFCTTFGLSTTGRLTRNNLIEVQEFYFDNLNDINNENIQTLSFGKSCNGHLKYPAAKLIDMYGFTRNRIIS